MKRQKHHTISTEKVFLYSGECILFLALLFLIINSGNVDMVIRLGVPIILGAVALVLTTRFVK